MKIPDTAVLTGDDYWIMRDAWKIEWEKGVQVIVTTCSTTLNACSVIMITVINLDLIEKFNLEFLFWLCLKHV